MKKYRILRKHYRESKTQKLIPYYAIQEYLNVGWCKKRWEWVDMTKTLGYYGNTWRENIDFLNLREAYDYLTNMKEQAQPDKVLKVIEVKTT